MAWTLDPETLEALRALPPEQVIPRLKALFYREGGGGSDEFLQLCEQLVEEGILTWDQIEALA